MMLKSTGCLCLLLNLVLTLPAGAQPPDALLSFKVGDEVRKTVVLRTLRDNLKERAISLYDAEYRRNKNYRAFRFLDVLEYIYGEELTATQWTSVTFTALDGYQAVADIDKVSNGDAYLVFADRDFAGWEDIPGHADTKPGPYYLVWKAREQTTRDGYPWPWQIRDISLVRVAKQYPAAYPADRETDAAIMSGYKLFMSRCISCHAVSGQGGKIGPDLNAPMNVLRYRSEHMVRSFIRAPSNYRYSRMPDFPDLSESELDRLIDYLWYLNRKGTPQQ